MLCLLLLSISCTSTNKSTKSGNQSAGKSSDEIIDVNFCDLIKTPEKYEQKQVRVKAIYRYGFEFSQMYSLKCLTRTDVRVEAREAKCTNAGRVDEMDATGYDEGRTVGVVVVGRLSGPERDTYHPSGAGYLFTVDCFVRAEMLDRAGYIPASLTPEQRRKVEEFESSN